MSETGRDFLNVVRHQNQVGRIPLFGSQTFDEPEESHPGDWVEAGARFIENQDLKLCHDRPANQCPLAFALAHLLPGAICSISKLVALQNLQGRLLFLRLNPPPIIDLVVDAAHDNLQSGLVAVDPISDGMIDDADDFSQRTPIRFAKCLSQDMDVSFRGLKEAG